MRITLIVALILACIAHHAVFAQRGRGQQKNDFADEPILSPSPSVSTGFVFPTSSSRVFMLGEPITVVAGVSNEGDSPVNVTSLRVSLVYPQDWRVHIQNFSRIHVDKVVAPHEHGSFAYTFMPDPLIEPREFALTGRIYYSTPEGENFTSIFLNHTFVLVENSADSGLDPQTLFTYIGIVGVLGLIAFFVYRSLGGMSKKSSRPKVEYGTQKKMEIDTDWLEGTHAMSPKVPRSPVRATKIKKTA